MSREKSTMLVELFLSGSVREKLAMKCVCPRFVRGESENQQIEIHTSLLHLIKGYSGSLQFASKTTKSAFSSYNSCHLTAIDKSLDEFLEFLSLQVMENYDQENGDAYKSVLTTKDGIDLLALYHSSVGRFRNAPGAMIYPIYGQGELLQAFCRGAAVKGCIYVLRIPINSLPMEKASGSYKGLCLASE